MIEHIKQLAQTILLTQANKRPAVVYKNISTHELLAAICDELYKLDPRDFEPAAQHDFIVTRAALKAEAHNPAHNIEFVPDLVNAVLPHLERYRGAGIRAKRRDFTFISNADVRAIVERDYFELDQRALPDGSWKSTVIIAGSILEAVLYDRLTADFAAVAAAMGAHAAPNRRGGGKKNIAVAGWQDEWTLSDLIEVAAELGIIPHEHTIHQVLREYRNFVHVRKEVQSGVHISEGHAYASKGMLDVILDHLTP